ncbi:MAG: glutamate--tRNA ligase [Candidatus Cloacimonetes bacterium]|nr:glutamate--tRNA ligase [Candidatus Cloacimonadota bacterium]
MEKPIRVRFAPSPTGYLHVGSLRTALYNYLYARKTGGRFILRIEDTDRSRYVAGAVENLLNTLNAVGLNFDEGPGKEGTSGPYFQSQRLPLYRQHLQQLIAEEKAYYCFCKPDELEKMRSEQISRNQHPMYDKRCRNIKPREARARVEAGEEHVIRLKVPEEGAITFFDIVRGEVTFPWEMVDDQVLMKSDGFPTYHLANVVDDHLMEISHIIRGEEWLSSVPKHLLLYGCFGWTPPRLAHLPLLLNPDKSKLSKRQGDVSAEDFLKKGYLPEALINYVALLGWHTGSDREFYSLTELEKEFSLKRITKAGAVFDVEKLKWMNSWYIRNLPLENIVARAQPFLKAAGIAIQDTLLHQSVKLLRERVTLLSELPGVYDSFFGELNFDDEQEEIISQPGSQSIYRFWLEKLEEQKSWNESDLSSLVALTTTRLNVKGKNLYFPLRLAMIGQTHGPDLPALFEIIGRDNLIKRLQKCLR